MRRLLFLLTVLVLLAPACATPTPEPTPEGLFEPLPSVNVESATILIPNTVPSGINFDDTIVRLNGMLEEKGQAVRFLLRASSYNSTGNTFLNQARQELAAGNPGADAYALSVNDSRAFFNEKLTMDVSTLIKQNAPVYCSRYAGMFEETMPGIPVGLYGKPVMFKTSFIIRQDYLKAGAGVTTLDALFAFLDEAIVKPAENKCVLADPGTLALQWALEQGYYSLGMYGVGGYLFAATDDPKCTPVPIESIPGMEDFLSRMMPYYKSYALSSTFYGVYSKEPIGFVKDLSDYCISNPFGWLAWIPGEFTAVVMSPEQPNYFSDATYIGELAVPAACPPVKAAQVAAFVEWYNTSQENYDVVMYGQPGVDFMESASRFVPLRKGVNQNMKTITQMQDLFFTWPGATAINNTAYFRVPVSAPVNLEQLVDERLQRGLRFEVNKYLKIDQETSDAMSELSEGMADISIARNNALNGLIYYSPASYTKSVYDSCMDTLSKLRTDLLVQDYQRLIGKFMTNMR